MNVARPAASGRRTLPEWRRFRFPRSLYKYALLALAAWIVWWTLDVLNIDPERLPGIVGRIGDVLATRYWPPDLERIRQPDFIHAVVETFQMSYVATLLGLLFAIPLAWFASLTMTPSRRWLFAPARLVVVTARSVHEMIWTILLVAIIGFGMLPGALAMTLYCVGFS